MPKDIVLSSFFCFSDLLSARLHLCMLSMHSQSQKALPRKYWLIQQLLKEFTTPLVSRFMASELPLYFDVQLFAWMHMCSHAYSSVDE